MWPMCNSFQVIVSNTFISFRNSIALLFSSRSDFQRLWSSKKSLSMLMAMITASGK